MARKSRLSGARQDLAFAIWYRCGTYPETAQILDDRYGIKISSRSLAEIAEKNRWKERLKKVKRLDEIVKLNLIEVEHMVDPDKLLAFNVLSRLMGEAALAIDGGEVVFRTPSAVISVIKEIRRLIEELPTLESGEALALNSLRRQAPRRGNGKKRDVDVMPLNPSGEESLEDGYEDDILLDDFDEFEGIMPPQD